MDVDQQGNDGWEDVEGENTGLYTLPPGEEGLYHSHAGGETIFQQIMDDIEPQYVHNPFPFCFHDCFPLGSEGIHVIARTVSKHVSMHGAGNYHGWWMHTLHGETKAQAARD